MQPEIIKNVIEHKTKSPNPAVYPIEVYRFTISAAEVPADKSLAQFCESGCPSYGRNGACPPYSPDYLDLARGYNQATVIYIKLMAEHYPARMLHGKRLVSWKFTESFLPVFLRKQVLELARQTRGFPMTAGHCTGCRRCCFKVGDEDCKKPVARVYSVGGCGVNVVELMAKFSDSPLEWWDPAEKDYIPPYQLRVGLVLHSDR